MTYLLVGIAGALGAVCRVGIYAATGPQRWPWVTLSINVVGSFMLGLIITLSAHRMPAEYRTAATGGFLGAFTTFSTFTYEGVDLINDGRVMAAAWYLGASVALGLSAVLIGIALANWLTS